MERNSNRLLRIICLAVILMMAFMLSGCRTRIIDSDEVTVTVYDEDGMRREEYKYRREELGLYETKNSLFSRFWSSYDDSEEDFFDDEDDIDYDEYEEEDPPDTDTDTSVKKSDEDDESHRAVPHVRPAGQNAIIVTLDANGGEIRVASAAVQKAAIRVKKGGTYGPLPVPVYEGFTFEGWFTEKDKGSLVTKDTKIENSDDHTLYAHWKKGGDEGDEKDPEKDKKITVSFDPNGGETDASPVRLKVGGRYGTLPEASRDGYSFEGWFTDKKKGSRVDENTKVTSETDHTLYAHWKKEEKDPEKPGDDPGDDPGKPGDEQKSEITVSFDPNGGEVSIGSIGLNAGDAYGSLPVAIREGYDFEGWYTEKSGGTLITSETKVISDDDHTLYAHWKESEKEPEPEPPEEDEPVVLAITFNYEDGTTYPSKDERSLKDGDKYGDLKDASRRGYDFRGWFTEPDGKGEQVTADTLFEGKEDKSIDLYAFWEKDPERYWAAKLSDSTDRKKDDEKWFCYIYKDKGGMSSDAESFLKGSGGRVPDPKEGETVDRIILLTDDSDDSTKVDDLVAKFWVDNGDLSLNDKASRIILPPEALSTTDDSKRLYYKIYLFNELYGGYDEEMEEIKTELGIED